MKLNKVYSGLVLVGSALMAGVANAAATVDISAATSQATEDVKAAGALIIGVVVAVAAIGGIRRVIR